MSTWRMCGLAKVTPTFDFDPSLRIDDHLPYHHDCIHGLPGSAR